MVRLRVDDSWRLGREKVCLAVLERNMKEVRIMMGEDGRYRCRSATRHLCLPVPLSVEGIYWKYEPHAHSAFVPYHMTKIGRTISKYLSRFQLSSWTR